MYNQTLRSGKLTRQSYNNFEDERMKGGKEDGLLFLRVVKIAWPVIDPADAFSPFDL